MKQIIQ